MSDICLPSASLAVSEKTIPRDEQPDVYLEKEEDEDEVFTPITTGRINSQESTDNEDEVEELSNVILTFQFDSCTEKKHLEYEQTMKDLRKDVSCIRERLETLEGQLSKELRDAVQEQLNAIKVKDSRLDDKEFHLSKQLVQAVAAAVNALVNSGHLVRTDTLMTDPLFKSQVERVILTHLLQYDKIVDRVVERSMQMVDDMFNRETL